MNSKKSILAALSSLLFFCLATNASAGDPVKCERRNSPARSTISVKAEGLVPSTIYTVDVSSGLNTASATGAASLFGDLEVDFDSNRNDILAGATALAPSFIGGDVTAKITKQLGGEVAVNLTAICRIR